MEEATEIMIQLIRSEVCLDTVKPISDYAIDNKTLVDILVLSRKHGVSLIVASALLRNGLITDSPQECLFQREMYLSVFLYEKTMAVYEKIRAVFQSNKICYIPLKGAVMRNLYPEPWMRSSCDIDILVKKCDLKRAVDILIKKLSFVFKSQTKHDITLISQDGICLELHFKLFETKRTPLYSRLLSDVWMYSEPVESDMYEYRMTSDYFYFYHIFHMAKHFRIGGCGLRPFLDLWLLNQFRDSDSNSLLEIGKITEFERYARSLSQVWFSGASHDNVTLLMQDYVISGGSFGSEKTRMMADRNRYDNRFKYILSRIFVPKEYLQADYPVLNKFPILFPIFTIVRLFSFTIGKKRNFAVRQIIKFSDVKDTAETEMLKILGF